MGLVGLMSVGLFGCGFVLVFGFFVIFVLIVGFVGFWFDLCILLFDFDALVGFCGW